MTNTCKCWRKAYFLNFQKQTSMVNAHTQYLKNRIHVSAYSACDDKWVVLHYSFYSVNSPSNRIISTYAYGHTVNKLVYNVTQTHYIKTQKQQSRTTISVDKTLEMKHCLYRNPSSQPSTQITQCVVKQRLRLLSAKIKVERLLALTSS